MGFNFRKSVKMGPVRFNLSKSGVGYSIGTKGARITKSTKGKTKVTAGIPGTGLSFSKAVGKKKNSHKKHSADRKTTTAQRTTANTKQTTTSNTSKPVEKSWFMAILMTILSFVVVGLVSFIILFILCAIARLFIRDGWSTGVARFIIIGVPIILGVLSGFIAFCVTRPEDSSESCTSGGIASPTISKASNDPDKIPDSVADSTEPLHLNEADSPSSTIKQQLAAAYAQFNSELQSIPQVDISLSDPVPRHLLKEMPPYDFSNITRKTRLDSIFPLVVLDVETTGLYPSKHEIIEVSAIKFDTGMVPIACFTTFCKPKNPIPSEATAINHITDDMVADAPSFAQIAPALSNFIQGNNVVGHNLDFDLRFIFAHGTDLPEGKRFYDTLDLAQLTIPKSQIDNYKLETLCSYYGVWRESSHSSLSDCYATSKILFHLVFDKTDRRLDEAPGDVPDSDT